MEFSCHTWAFNDLTLPEALGTIARLGFRYVDLGSGPHLNLQRAAKLSTRTRTVNEIRGDLETFNLNLSDLYLTLPRISVADEEKRQADIDMFKTLLPFAQGLNVPGITLSPGLIHPKSDEEAQDRTIAALRDMVSAANQADIPISIEPHMDSMAQTPEQALKFVNAVPGLELTLDWAQMVCQDVRHEQIVELLPHTRHIQMRQAARAQLQLPFDRGRIRIPDVIQALNDSDYEGIVGIEYMQAEGWHGMEKVNYIVECYTMRDALRDERDKQAKSVKDKA